jgi:type IV pilus assembly protein PilM
MGILDNLLKKKQTSALGIDIGSSSIKVVQLKKDGEKAVLETYGELSLGPYGGVSVGQSTNLPTEKIIEAMSDLLKEKEVAITTYVSGLAIPLKASLLSIIEIPTLSESELNSLIPLEARKYIPVPISDVTIDWSIIPKLQNDEGDEGVDRLKPKTMDVLLVAIHNNIINQYKEIVAKTGLDAKFFEIEVFSSMRSILNNSDNPVLILDIGASSTKLYIIERSVVVQSHTINTGSQEITANIARNLNISREEAEVIKRSVGAGQTANGVNLLDSVTLVTDIILSEANRFLFSYQKKNNKDIKSVLLVGGGSAMKGFREIAGKNFKVEVVSGNPFEKIQVPAFLEDILRQTGPEFTVAAGCALRCLAESS